MEQIHTLETKDSDHVVFYISPLGKTIAVLGLEKEPGTRCRKGRGLNTPC